MKPLWFVSFATENGFGQAVLELAHPPENGQDLDEIEKMLQQDGSLGRKPVLLYYRQMEDR